MKERDGVKPKGRKGASGLEYGVVLGLVAVVALAAASTLGSKVREVFGPTANVVNAFSSM